MLPRCDDTVSSLVSRLSQSSFLEDSRVLQGGRGPRRVRLNDTDYAQPRRRSWSVKVEVEGEGEDEVGSTTTSLLNYTAFGRLPEDLEAVPMPRPVFNLGVALWTVAFDFLTDLSKRHPPIEGGAGALLNPQSVALADGAPSQRLRDAGRARARL